MKRNEFKKCFELISPTDAQKQRMLNNIMNSKTQKVKKISFAKAASFVVPIAAAAAVLAFGINTFFEKDSMPDVLKVQTADKQKTAKPNQNAGVFEQTDENAKAPEKVAANDNRANSSGEKAKGSTEDFVKYEQPVYTDEAEHWQNDTEVSEKSPESASGYSLNKSSFEDKSSHDDVNLGSDAASTAGGSAGNLLESRMVTEDKETRTAYFKDAEMEEDISDAPVSPGVNAAKSEDIRLVNTDSEFESFAQKCNIMKMKGLQTISPVQVQRNIK